MPRDNVDTVRRIYELVEADGIEGLLGMATDDVIWTSDPRFPGGGRFSGKDNVQRWLRKLWIYDEVSIDVEEIVDLGETVLGITRFHGVSLRVPRP
jgi:hypothetical protein